MQISGRSGQTVQRCGAIWIVLAPVLWLMAAISTVRSDTAYSVQLSAFSTVAVLGLICGVVALGRYSWAAWGLFIVSSVGAAYFLGTAAYLLIFPFVPWSTLKDPGLPSLPLAFALSMMIAGPGIPLVLMARAVRRAIRPKPLTEAS
jgi:hypothetical protein